MRNNTLLLVLALAFVGSTCAVPVSQQTWTPDYTVAPLEDSDRIARMRPSCVTVLREDPVSVLPFAIELTLHPIGAGVIVKSVPEQPLVILTAGHVAADIEKNGGYIHVPRGSDEVEILKVRVTVMSPDYDLALMESVDPWDGQDVAAVLSDAAPRRGDELYIIGSPSGVEWSVSRGLLSATEACPKGQGTCYRTDGAIYFGNSGGGVFLRDGRLIGIADYVHTDTVTGRDGDKHNIVTPGAGGIVSWYSVGVFLKENLK